tara:strand:- start:86 stop:571 length:486 start_codon:yes stop_codon:yes gene_type:complete
MFSRNVIVFPLTLLILMSGCTSPQTSALCGEGYDEMYGGYDYIYVSTSIDTDNSLNITVQILGGGGGWLEESDIHEANQEVTVGLTVKLGDGSEQSIGYGSQTWTVEGDEHDGSYWLSLLYFQSPAGFCDTGCEEIKFSGGEQDAVYYYDETCDSSPWVDI